MTKIEKTDTGYEIAVKIFETLELHSSCTVSGFERGIEEPTPKGEVVIEELKQLDVDKNFSNGRRRRVKPENQIGDFVAQKAFKYAKRTVDGLIRYDFWRVQ